MLVTIISWIYMILICLSVGVGVQKVLDRWLHFHALSFTGYIVSGIVAITVYAEIFSIFYKVGMIAHCLLLITALICAWFCLDTWKFLFGLAKKHIFSWDALFYFGLVVLVAFFTSRGTFHTDTNIYHAGAIRIYEEYGLIKGMGNLQLHYAYNSAYLAFASIFSLSWLLPWSLHTTTGFIEVILCIYACHGLKNFWTRKKHLADLGRVALLIYAIVNLCGSQSPATDYGTMFLSLYIICAWLDNMEQTRNTGKYILLSIASLFVATMKLSAASMVLLALLPGITMLKNKEWKKIIFSICMGCIVFFPFLIRNFLISGWLFYPFESIDLFPVSWKVPLASLLVDSAQIKVWGRCLYDVNLIDMPISQWLPIWWESQERYSQMLIYANVLGLFLMITNLIHKLIQHKKTDFDLILLYSMLLCSALIWLFTAPFIRYGLAFLLVFPLLGIGAWFAEERRGLYSLISGSLTLLIALCFFPYIDHYITDDGVFIKHNLSKPYYITQVPYDTAETGSYVLNGNTIYYSVDGIVNSYYYTPNTCYEQMLLHAELVDDNLRHGFRPKE